MVLTKMIARTNKTRSTMLLVGLCAGVGGGCGAPVTLQPPGDFVLLEEDDAPYDARATNAHGVVLAARAVPNEPQGALSFWVDAIKNKVRTLGGYALVEEDDVTAATGQTGRRLKFGRDHGSQTHLYWLAVFVTADRVFLVEAGGRKDRFEPMADRVSKAFGRVRLD